MTVVLAEICRSSSWHLIKGQIITTYNSYIHTEQIPQVFSLPSADIYQQYHQHGMGSVVHSQKPCMVCLSGEGYLGEQLLHFQPSIQQDHTELAHAAQGFLKQTADGGYHSVEKH